MEMYDELDARLKKLEKLANDTSPLRIMVNGEIADDDYEIKEGDVILYERRTISDLNMPVGMTVGGFKARYS